MKLIYKTFLILLSVIIKVNSIKFHKSIRPVLPVLQASPCPHNGDIVSSFKTGLEDGYNITIKKSLTIATELRITFDSETALIPGTGAIYSGTEDNVYNIFKLFMIENNDKYTFNVKGHPAPYSPPYLTSLKINGEEYCKEANLTYFEDLPVGVTKRKNVPDRFCGKRKILHTELIVNGVNTKSGDWPWHVAIYRQEKSSLRYVCGGTLISKNFVLTAAHCTTVNGSPLLPDVLGVFLGKYHLFQSDATTQEIQVFQVIVHDEYSHKDLKNDISLLKLRAEVVFNNYVQPACLWFDEAYDKLTSYEILGTVAGWGFDRTDSLSSTLHAARMPLIPNYSCILSNPIFYSNALRNNKKFCAGFANGTSACNGDSGGGFLVFIPDAIGDKVGNKVPGAWYVRGIVSASLSRGDAAICDPNSYAIFTDVSKYLTWIKDYITSN
ncbi:chymotrypsin-like elastase family member 2A [Nymphalis io]|uniref:chymotrypsin-like elastase family member 2A n=1 Tax=Inachis io TaxID=171585 RepID=UPI002166C9BB|nr:chymotrypsin-like elastase family member 2A [Nymphalis io]